MLRSTRVRQNCQTDEREEGRQKLSVASAQHSTAGQRTLHCTVPLRRTTTSAGPDGTATDWEPHNSRAWSSVKMLQKTTFQIKWTTLMQQIDNIWPKVCGHLKSQNSSFRAVRSTKKKAIGLINQCWLICGLIFISCQKMVTDFQSPQWLPKMSHSVYCHAGGKTAGHFTHLRRSNQRNYYH